jgi:hypothetical protein
MFNKSLGVWSTKMQVCDTFVVPHFLYGSETWNLTQTQKKWLEVAYSSCLRKILGVKVWNRHRFTHIWEACKAKPLTLLLKQHKLRWLGHVAKLPQDSYLHIALLVHLKGDLYPRGYPRHRFVTTLKGDFLVAGIPIYGGGGMSRRRTKKFGAQWCRDSNSNLKRRHECNQTTRANASGVRSLLCSVLCNTI